MVWSISHCSSLLWSPHEVGENRHQILGLHIFWVSKAKKKTKPWGTHLQGHGEKDFARRWSGSEVFQNISTVVFFIAPIILSYFESPSLMLFKKSFIKKKNPLLSHHCTRH